MTVIYVQFTDVTEQVIQTCFTGPQDPAQWPNQGTVETSDARWKVFYNMLAAVYMADGLPAPTST
jgi:hypothetical protein